MSFYDSIFTSFHLPVYYYGQPIHAHIVKLCHMVINVVLVSFICFVSGAVLLQTQALLILTGTYSL